MSKALDFVKYRFPALAARNFRLFLAGQSISLLGTMMHRPVLKWVVYQQTYSTAALGWVEFLGAIPITALVVLTGVVADRHSKRNIVICSQSVLLLVAAAFGVFALSGLLSMQVIYALVLITGVARAFDIPTRQAFIMEVSGREAYGNAIALNSTVLNTGRIIGPTVGMLLLAGAGAAACFFSNSASYLAILIALVLMRNTGPSVPRAKRQGVGDFAEGLRYVLANRTILVTLILWAAFSLFGTAYITLLPAIAMDIYGKEATQYGLLFSVQGVGALVGAVIMAATARGARPERRVMFGVALVCAALLSLGFTRSYLPALVLAALLGFGRVVFLVSANILIQMLCEDAFRGRVMGFRTLVFGGLHPLGALLAGYIAKYMGNPLWAVWIGGIVLTAAFFVFAPQLLRTRVQAGEGSGEQRFPDGDAA